MLFFFLKPLLDLDPLGRTELRLVLIPSEPLSDVRGKVPLGGSEGSRNQNKTARDQDIGLTLPQSDCLCFLTESSGFSMPLAQAS